MERSTYRHRPIFLLGIYTLSLQKAKIRTPSYTTSLYTYSSCIHYPKSLDTNSRHSLYSYSSFIHSLCKKLQYGLQVLPQTYIPTHQLYTILAKSFNTNSKFCHKHIFLLVSFTLSLQKVRYVLLSSATSLYSYSSYIHNILAKKP